MNGPSFRFRVKAPHNANVCLSGAAAEVPQHMYEIFLGGWEGKESAIRRNKKDDVCKVKTPNLLNAYDFRGFWVVVTSNTIKVGREGESKPFMTHTDHMVPLRLTYYGYCTAYGASGSWIFADDDPTHFNPWLDLSDLLGALAEQPKPPPSAPSYGFIPKHIVGNAASNSTTETMKWISCRHGSKCAAPVSVTNGSNSPIVALAYHNGGLIPGVLMPNTNVCYISWGGQSIAKNDYFLLSNPGIVEFIWLSASNGSVPNGAIEGGYSETGEKLFIGRFSVNGAVISGKVHPSHRVCYIPYWGSENSSARYDVLCLKTVPLSILGIQ